MKILVTGHLGYIGSHLAEVLKDEVIGLDIKEGNDIVTCELPDVDVVFHLAAIADVIKSLEDPTEVVRTNTLGTVRLAEKYKDIKFIFASTAAAEEILSPYGLSKYCAEEFIKMLFNNYVILRFPNVYGGQGSRSVIDKFLNEDITIYGDGTQTRTFIHVDDIVRGMIESLEWKNGTYHLGCEENYSVLELAQATGKPYKFSDWRKGEIKHSIVKNTAPGWQPIINAIEYIKSKI